MTEHNEISRWFEGESCPFCHDEENDYYIETQGGGHEEYVRYCYQCPKCEKEWYNESQFLTWEIVK